MQLTQVKLTIPDSLDVTRLTGPSDALLRQVERSTDAAITIRGNVISISGSVAEVNRMTTLFSRLMHQIEEGESPDAADVSLLLEQTQLGMVPDIHSSDEILLTYRGRAIRPKTDGQKTYIDAIKSNIVTFAEGPAGTGKTYLAMAMAVAALKRREVSRIVLTRPVVEAGESLGYLPGTLEEKLDPYVRPLYDALFDMCDMEKGNSLIEQGVIEIAPLAFMRGRTLNDAFVILDEAQNTTPEQMKMFLTRLGFRSKFVVTGDTTQRDLLGKNGLVDAKRILEGVEDIAFCTLDRSDVVRHTLVGRIVDAYAAADEAKKA
jgi:phosphate starvation-inducible PhoH-like protein